MPSSRAYNLDLVRGISAVFVLLSHCRSFLLVDYHENEDLMIAQKAAYLLSGLGHQAVVVFFVLSGYLVGGIVANQCARGTFYWKKYSIARLSRLWVVAIPSLVLTFVLDKVGMESIPTAYSGAFYETFNQGPSKGHPAAHGFLVLFGNIAFLQTIVVPSYGTNGPLWSLANEAFYYFVFPLAVIACMRFRSKAYLRGFFEGIAALCAIWISLALNVGIAEGGLVWLLGVVAHVAENRVPHHIVWRCLLTIPLSVSLAFLTVVLLLSKIGIPQYSDLMIGTAFAMALPRLVHCEHQLRTGLLRKLAVSLSEVSFSLYLTHFPLLFFISAVLYNGKQERGGAYGWCLVGGWSIFCICCACVFWYLFERHTQTLRDAVQRLMKA